MRVISSQIFARLTCLEFSDSFGFVAWAKIKLNLHLVLYLFNFVSGSRCLCSIVRFNRHLSKIEVCFCSQKEIGCQGKILEIKECDVEKGRVADGSGGCKQLPGCLLAAKDGTCKTCSKKFV